VAKAVALVVVVTTTAIATHTTPDPVTAARAAPTVLADDQAGMVTAQWAAVTAQTVERLEAERAALEEQERVARAESERLALEAIEASERIRAEQAAAASPARSAVAVAPGPAPTSPGPCGGDYPPCQVAQRESGNSYTAINPGGCGGQGCYGRWQFSGAWAGKLGLPLDLTQATPQQQDEAARLLWNHGAGCSNWSSC
jgi:hypothetical protein